MTTLLSTRFLCLMLPFFTVACSEPGGNLIRPTDRGLFPEDDILPSDYLEDEGIAPQPDNSIPDPGLSLDPGTSDPGVPHAPIRFVTNAEVLPTVLDLIDGAQTEIRLATLEFLAGSLPDKIDSALAGAKMRGVDIRVLLDKDTDGNDTRLTSLGLKGIPCKPTTSGKTLHVKILVVDRRKVLVGSSNYSTSALKYNNEANWLLDIDGPGPACAAYVDQLWDDDATTAKLGQDFGNVRLIGDRQYADRVVPVIAGATGRIRLAMYQMDADGGPGDDSEALVSALLAAVGRAVDVRVVLDKGTFDSVTSANEKARKRLLSGGVDVRMDPADTTTHAKVLVADDTTVVYSGNWVYTGLEKNHEAGAIVADPAISEAAAAWFDGIWAASQ